MIINIPAMESKAPEIIGIVNFSCQRMTPNNIPKIINATYEIIENIDCGAPKL